MIPFTVRGGFDFEATPCIALTIPVLEVLEGESIALGCLQINEGASNLAALGSGSFASCWSNF